jgi:hypothetical protein
MHHAAAAAFFADVEELLAEPQLQKVYWAQWVDDSIGMLSEDLHRRALFNAYEAYQTLIPTTRRSMQWIDAGPLDGMAAADGRAAAIVIWNKSDADRSIAISISGQTATVKIRLFRIDAHHASYGDDRGSELLEPTEQWSYSGRSTNWSGSVPGKSVILFRTDAH